MSADRIAQMRCDIHGSSVGFILPIPRDLSGGRGHRLAVSLLTPAVALWVCHLRSHGLDGPRH